MLSHLHLPRHGDGAITIEFYNQFKALSDDALLKVCESSKKTGIVGSHIQGLRLIELYKVSLERNIPTDISFEQDCLICFK